MEYPCATKSTATLLKKRLRCICIPVNFAKFLRTPILVNICELLLQSGCRDPVKNNQQQVLLRAAVLACGQLSALDNKPSMLTLTVSMHTLQKQ